MVVVVTGDVQRSRASEFYDSANVPERGGYLGVGVGVALYRDV